MKSRSSSGCRGLLVAVLTGFSVLVALGGCGGDGAPSDPRDQVIATVVSPATLHHELIVFVHPEPLVPGDRIGPYTPPGRLEPAPMRTIERATWFYWIDDAPSARFAHPTRYVFVDAVTGEIEVEAQEWWPVLNGAGLWTDASDYWDDSRWVYATVGGDGAEKPEETALGGGMKQLDPPPLVVGDGRREGALSATSAGPSAKPGMAVVINGWKEGESGQGDFQTDAQNMHDALEAAGFDTTYLGDPADDAPERDGINDDAARAAFFANAAATLGCDDTLVVYVSAHGSVIEDGSLAGLAHSDGLWEDELAAFLRTVPDCVKVIVVIDSCHSGGFLDGLVPVADLVITATDQDHSSYADIDGPDDPNPNDAGGEFTGGLVAGLFEHLGTPGSLDDAQEKADETGSSLWEVVFDEAFDTALDLDAAYRGGLTHPQKVAGDRGAACPGKGCGSDPAGCGSGGCALPPLGCGDLPGVCGAAEGSEASELAKAIALLMGVDPGDPSFCQAPCEGGGSSGAGNDTVHSNGTLTAPAEAEVDILQYGTLKLTLTPELASAGALLFPCGSSDLGTTLCNGPASDLEAGDYHLFYQLLDGAVPVALPGSFYQYGFALDADSDTTNNYVPLAQYPKDFFGGTDLWYQVNGSPSAGFSLRVTDARGGTPQDAASAARVLVLGNALALLAPANEIAAESPGYRVTAFRHTGDYGINPPHVWSGDVAPVSDAPLAH